MEEEAGNKSRANGKDGIGRSELPCNSLFSLSTTTTTWFHHHLQLKFPLPFLPFLKQSSYSSSSSSSCSSSSTIDTNAQNLLSSAHTFFFHNQTLIHSLYSHFHTFFHFLLSFPSHLHDFSSQIQCRKPKGPNTLSLHNFAAILPGDSVTSLVVSNGILNFLNIYNSLLVVRLVLTWFPNSPPAIVSPLSTLCDPYLNIFRGIIPPLGGTLDLSPILAFLVLNAFTSAAAALPAELPVNGVPQNTCSSTLKPWNLTTMQQKWMRRLNRKGPKNSDDQT